MTKAHVFITKDVQTDIITDKDECGSNIENLVISVKTVEL